MKKKLALKSLAGILIVILLLIGGWILFDSVFTSTADSNFCGSCHEMQSMVTAYNQDIHGGNNEHSIQATCVACHLDHTNSISYFISKTKAGIRDYVASAFQNTDKIDWEAKRKNRTTFVFDSGCLTCHRILSNPTKTSTRAWVAHRPYFMGKIDQSCTSCHKHVGHKNLSMFLSRKKGN